MIWFIYFGLAIASGAWAWISGQWLPLVVVCAAVILTIVLESVLRQNATKPPFMDVTDYPYVHKDGETFIPYIDPRSTEYSEEARLKD